MKAYIVEKQCVSDVPGIGLVSRRYIYLSKKILSTDRGVYLKFNGVIEEIISLPMGHKNVAMINIPMKTIKQAQSFLKCQSELRKISEKLRGGFWSLGTEITDKIG